VHSHPLQVNTTPATKPYTAREEKVSPKFVRSEEVQIALPKIAVGCGQYLVVAIDRLAQKLPDYTRFVGFVTVITT
jgi:hypothetical protein